MTPLDTIGGHESQHSKASSLLHGPTVEELQTDQRDEGVRTTHVCVQEGEEEKRDRKCLFALLRNENEARGGGGGTVGRQALQMRLLSLGCRASYGFKATARNRSSLARALIRHLGSGAKLLFFHKIARKLLFLCFFFHPRGEDHTKTTLSIFHAAAAAVAFCPYFDSKRNSCPVHT